MTASQQQTMRRKWRVEEVSHGGDMLTRWHSDSAQAYIDVFALIEPSSLSKSSYLGETCL